MWGTNKLQRGGRHGTPTATGGSKRRSLASATTIVALGLGTLGMGIATAGPAIATQPTKTITSVGEYMCESGDVLVEATYLITDVVEKAGPPEFINVPRTSGDVEVELSEFIEGVAAYVLPIVDSTDVVTGNATADIYKKWSGNFTVTLNCEPGGDPDPTPVCVDPSKKVLSHEYARNNGSVTVKKGKELCKKLYATIVRWSYVDEGSQWPQVVADKTTVSLKKGTKEFSVSDGCGQFDVYYGYGKAPKLPEQLNGPNNPFEPPFLHQISSGPNPTYTVDNPKDCVTPPKKDATGDFTLTGKCGVGNDTVTPTAVNATAGEPVWNGTKVSVTFTAEPDHTDSEGRTTWTVTKDEVNTSDCVTTTPTPTLTPTATSTVSPQPTPTKSGPAVNKVNADFPASTNAQVSDTSGNSFSLMLMSVGALAILFGLSRLGFVLMPVLDRNRRGNH